jgi:hypothetical protein
MDMRTRLNRKVLIGKFEPHGGRFTQQIEDTLQVVAPDSSQSIY